MTRLAAAGASFFACPDNSAFLALEQAGEPLPLPGLHIAVEVADTAATERRRRVGILGTRFTMDGPIYPRELESRGIEHRLPLEEDRKVVDDIMLDELLYGVCSDTSRRTYQRIIHPVARSGSLRGGRGVAADAHVAGRSARRIAPPALAIRPHERVARGGGKGSGLGRTLVSTSRSGRLIWT